MTNPSKKSAIRKLWSRKKIVLLRGAARKGAWSFLRQLSVTTEDFFIMRRHLVFRLEASDLIKRPIELGFSCREVYRWEDLPDKLRRRLVLHGDSLEWGDSNWFDVGRRLWVASQNGQVCGLCWLLDCPSEEDFFCPVPSDNDVIFQTVVFPEFRGQGIQVKLYDHLMTCRANTGTSAFLVSCHAYNQTSRRNIEMLGFRLIGYRRDFRFMFHSSWHSLGSRSA